MNSTATRFVYSFVPPHTYSQGLSQLASAEINPTNLGSAPAILNPSVHPNYAVAGGSAPSTVTAGISPHDHVIGVDYAILRNGLVEDPVNGVIFFKVVDPASASLKVQDYRLAIWRMAQATLRDAVGGLTLDELLSQQVKLETEIARNVETSSRAWGETACPGRGPRRSRR